MKPKDAHIMYKFFIVEVTETTTHTMKKTQSIDRWQVECRSTSATEAERQILKAVKTGRANEVSITLSVKCIGEAETAPKICASYLRGKTYPNRYEPVIYKPNYR